MKAYLEGWSIVLAGYWNHYIFSPEWITDKLTKSTKVSVEFPINTPFSPPRYRFDNVIMQFSVGELILHPEASDDTTLETLKNLAGNILTELPHTPIHAAGINFVFVEDDPSELLLNIFDISDRESLSTKGFRIKSTKVERMLTLGEQTLNLLLQLKENNQAYISLNFHMDVRDSGKAKEFIEANSISGLRDRAYKILDELYDTSLS
ncbi:MAG: hypothetical protein HQK59_09275 [Deltaproteobacteria bacterium]|nr:hypothetical protein [Deltaproteobacteria bacterium]